MGEVSIIGLELVKCGFQVRGAAAATSGGDCACKSFGASTLGHPGEEKRAHKGSGVSRLGATSVSWKM